MQAVSSTFLATINQSHRMKTQVGLFTAGGIEVVDLTPYLVGGSVSADKSASFRRTLSLSLADPLSEIIPKSLDDPLTIFGPKIKVWRGVYYADSTFEQASLGVFSISGIALQNGSNGPAITVTGYDSSRKISRSRVTTTITFDATDIDVSRSLAKFIATVYPRIPIQVTDSGFTSGSLGMQVCQPGDDPWAAAVAFAATAGLEIFVDVNDVCIIRPEPHLTVGSPDWYAETGTNLVAISRTLDDSETYNDIYATQNNPAINYYPGKNRAYDNSPGSPTYIYGDYGDVVLKVNNPWLNSNAKALKYAQTQLGLHLGMTDAVSFDILPNPAGDIDDIVFVYDPYTQVANNYLVDSFSIPLDAGTLETCTAKGFPYLGATG